MHKDIEKIWYEGKFRKVCEIESDHIHLDDGTVIREKEIKKIPFFGYKSTWSEKAAYKKLKSLCSYILKKLKKD